MPLKKDFWGIFPNPKPLIAALYLGKAKDFVKRTITDIKVSEETGIEEVMLNTSHAEVSYPLKDVLDEIAQLKEYREIIKSHPLLAEGVNLDHLADRLPYVDGVIAGPQLRKIRGFGYLPIDRYKSIEFMKEMKKWREDVK